MALNLIASKFVVPTCTKTRRFAVDIPARELSRVSAGNGVAARQMMTWTPYDNKFFETLSYLPPLSEDEIARQVAYITNNGWTPCLEFADAKHAYIESWSCVRFGVVSTNYNDNKFWTMWRLPMFGCTDPYQVQKEIDACVRTFPDVYVRIVGFDSVRQVQVAGFLVHRPASATDFASPGERSVAADLQSQGGYRRRR